MWFNQRIGRIRVCESTPIEDKGIASVARARCDASSHRSLRDALTSNLLGLMVTRRSKSTQPSASQPTSSVSSSQVARVHFNKFETRTSNQST